MRQVDVDRLIEALKDPIRTFVRESRARIALVVNRSGQVLAQHGFTGNFQVVNVAALAAATHASAGALAELTAAKRWTHLYHAGKERQLFLAPLRTPAGELILVVIFDHDSSVGIVQLFFDQLAKAITERPEFRMAYRESEAQSFERDLEAGLQRVLSVEAPSEG